MVTKWGMSDKVGLFYVDDKEKQSVEFQELIDVEVSIVELKNKWEYLIFVL